MPSSLLFAISIHISIQIQQEPHLSQIIIINLLKKRNEIFAIGKQKFFGRQMWLLAHTFFAKFAIFNISFLSVITKHKRVKSVTNNYIGY